MRNAINQAFPRALLGLLAAAALLPAQAYAAAAPADRIRKAALEMESGNYRAAAALLENNLTDQAALADDRTAGRTCELLSETYEKMGDQEKAVRTGTEGQERLRRVNDKPGQSECYRNIAKARAQQKLFGEAAEAYAGAVRLDRESERDGNLSLDLQNMAWMQEKAGDLRGALNTWQEVLRASGAENAGGRGECLLNIAAVSRKLGDTAGADKAAKEGEALRKKAESDAAKAHTDGAIDRIYFSGVQYRNSGDGVSARKAFEEMLAKARKRGFKNGVVTALLELGSEDMGSNRYGAAKEKLQEAARIAGEDGESLNESAALTYLGIAYGNTGEFSKGFSTLERARALSKKRKDAPDEIETLHGMRILYSILGDFPKVLETNARMTRIAEESGRKRVAMKAESDIGGFYGEIGDKQAAAEHYKKALDLAEQLGDPEDEFSQLNEYGVALMDMGEPDAAITALIRSLTLQDWAGGHVNLAEAFFYKGDLEKGAQQLAVMNPNHIDMGYYHLAKGEYTKAKTAYKWAIAGSSISANSVDLEFAGHTGAGLAYEGLGEYLKAAYHFREAQKVLERQRDSLSLEHRLYFLGVSDWMLPHIEPYEGLVRVSKFLPGGDRESLHDAEFTRSRLFTESAAHNYGAPDTRIPAALAERERALELAVSSAATQAKAANRSTDRAAYRNLEAGLEALKKQQLELAALLRRDYPEYAAVRYPQPLYPEEFALRPDEVLIEFEVTAPYTRVFVVKDGRVALSYDVKMTRSELSELVRKYRSFFEGVSGESSLGTFDPRLGNRLYQALLKPALETTGNEPPLVPPGAKVILVPDEILSILPFESLPISLPERASMPRGRFGPTPVGVRYLADSYDIAYAHSGTALTVQRRLKQRREPARDLLVLGDPIFSAADSRLRGSALAKNSGTVVRDDTISAIGKAMGLGGARGDAQKRAIGQEASIFPRLDKTGLLAHALSEKIFKGRASDILTSTTAAEGELLRRDLSSYRYIVLATHGILDDTVPGLHEPALVLNQVDNPPGRDGFLTMSEVMKLNLNADLVALTACQTGLGRHLTGEGVMGLGRAFQYAGARAVLVSLWSVSEDSTTMLVERFFGYLKDGKTPRLALRLAREDIRRAGYEHPFFWAPFILIGD
jgi:tetratricopeptide (TPR) repeat protein